MLGKEKCRILRQIRRRIAEENDIPYVTRECGFQGECRGSCPRCESELRYLEEQLARRAAMGRRVAVAALCAAVSLGASACSPFSSGGEPEPGTELSGAVAYTEPAPTGEPAIFTETGEVAWPDEPEQSGEDRLPPEPAGGEDPGFELMGDVAFVPEESGDG